jgi:hypothetical protein
MLPLTPLRHPTCSFWLVMQEHDEMQIYYRNGECNGVALAHTWGTVCVKGVCDCRRHFFFFGTVLVSPNSMHR